MLNLKLFGNYNIWFKVGSWQRGAIFWWNFFYEVELARGGFVTDSATQSSFTLVLLSESLLICFNVHLSFCQKVLEYKNLPSEKLSTLN